MFEQQKILNIPAIRRMPTYLHKLLEMQAEGRVSVSSTELAEYMNTELIVVRKDISLTGISGQRRIGYDVNELIRYIKAYLGWDEVIPAALVGAGSLGTALLGYDDFEHYGFRIEWVFDNAPDKIGRDVYGRTVLDVRDMARRVAALKLPFPVWLTDDLSCLPDPDFQEVPAAGRSFFQRLIRL